MEKIKFCKDCIHYEFQADIKQEYQRHLCSKPRNVVTGRRFLIMAYDMRSDRTKWLEDVHCGPEAKYFEPKEKGNI